MSSSKTKVKTQDIDTVLLDEAIANSGLKTSFIVDTLGISRQAFDKKRKGILSFRKSEVFVLCQLLQISDADSKKRIFNL